MEKFDDARQRLEAQYLDVRYEASSGWSKEELQAELKRHCFENPDEPRILTRAWLFHLLCSRARIAADPGDCFADKLEHHNLLIQLRDEWGSEEDKKEFGNDSPAVPGSFWACLDLSHTSPDWRNILAHGLPGLRDRAKDRCGAFYQAVAMVYDGAIVLVRRLAALCPNPALAALAGRPPRTFREALQLACLFHELQEMEGEWVRSMGRFDQLYHEFYANDLQSGLLTRDEAKELLKFFWIKFYARTQGKHFGKNFLFGPEVNELSYLAFEVYREMQTVDPKLSLRLGPETPGKFLDQVIGCIQAGSTGIVIANDPGQVRMLIENGRTSEDAEDYLLIGCYEPAVMGREMNCSGAAGLNLAKSVELTLANGDYESFDDFIGAYYRTLESQMAIAFDKVRRAERLWPRVNPSPLLSGSMDACLDKGLDVSQAGARYNTSGFVFVGLANAVDSLAVIRQFIYIEKRISMAELRTALAANWEGFEALRLAARNRVPKWGNDDGRVDGIAVEIARFIGSRVNHEPNARGGFFQAALYGILGQVQNFGRNTGTLPDGRRAGEALAINTGAMTAMERNGVTSLVNSVTRLDLSQFPSGTVLDVLFHPTAIAGEAGIQATSAVIRTHFEKGGMAIQFNIFDAATLRDAQKRPEAYANLQVRVCGWNARFTDLKLDEQEMFIARADAAS